MRYLGNKTRLIKTIEKFINDNKIEGKVFCDLFSGTSSVGDYFKDRYKIISNDFLGCANMLAQGKLLNNNIPAFNKFTKKFKVNPFEYFNSKEYEYKKQCLVTNYYSPKGNRQFFNENNAIKIDGIRIEIEELYKSKYFSESEYAFLLASLIESCTKFSNTTGTYEAFLKIWDSRSTKPFMLLPLEMKITNNIEKNIIYNDDSNKVIRQIEGDILYIDPPYTITEYSTAYHVLETISKYDYPEISGKTGRRNENKAKSSYTRKQLALSSFEDLIRQAQFKHIIISYSTQSIIPMEDLTKMLEKYSKNNSVTIKKIPYREYKNIRSSKKGDNLCELLIYIEKEVSIIKSPLNYSGSKDNIMNQINKYLPSNISTFIDCMGGAFNVGVNIVADKVIYNEFNPYVYDLIKNITTTDKKELVNYLEKQINYYNLEKSNSETYANFRNIYNSNQNFKDLFLLTMFCFQNQIRFNNSKKFNTPVGNCAYNETLKNRIINFIPRTKNIEFTNNSFIDIKFKNLDKNSLFYFDPPYFITNATYNDGKRGFVGWNSELETELLNFLTNLHEKGYKFMLSNVIYHKEKINHILLEWAKTNNFDIIEIEHSTRNEVLIINYELIGGIRQ